MINDNVTSGTLNISGGAYIATAPSSFGPAGSVKLEINGGTLGASTALTGSNAVANPLLFGTTRTLNIGGSSDLQLSSSLSLLGSDKLNDPAGLATLSGLIGGAGSLTITGSPTLSNSNTYTGGTTLGNGTAATMATITNNQGFSTGPITFNGGGFQSTTPLTGVTPSPILGSSVRPSTSAAPMRSSLPPALRFPTPTRNTSTSRTPA